MNGVVWILVNRVMGVNGPRDAMPVVVEKSAVEKMLGLNLA